MKRRSVFFLWVAGLVMGVSVAQSAPANHPAEPTADSMGTAAVQSFPLGADTDSKDTRPLTDFVRNLKTFSANFVQQQVNARGLKQPPSSGHFVLARPGRFYWIYEKPYVQKLIASDGTLWVYDPDLAQVTRSALAKDRGAPIGIFLGTKPLASVFTITAQGKNDGLSWFGLVDRSGKSDFSQLQVGLDDKGIKAMVFTDKLGNRTTVQFSARQVNESVDQSLFRFTPPAGVDVVENR